jgi:ketosteroid isomerase-like protein
VIDMADSKPHDAHHQFEDAYNSGKIDSLLALYTPDARLVTESGSVVIGHDAIRGELQGFFSIKGRVTVETISAVQAGTIALLRAQWRLTGLATGSAKWQDGRGRPAATGRAMALSHRQSPWFRIVMMEA